MNHLKFIDCKTIKTISIYSFAIIFLALFSCTKDIVDTTGNINGTIRDARTNDLINGASVTILELGKTTTTGSDGRYAFTNVESQKYTVQVTKSGYTSDSKSIFVNASVDNQLDFALTPSVGILSLDKLTLDFGNEITTLSFNIKNTGSAPLTWSINEDISWLTCSPASGTTQAGESSSVVVNVNRKDLERGNYTQNIAIASNGGSEVIRVNMMVQGITVSVSPEELDFGSTSTSMPLTLTNNGSGSVSYSLSPSNEWIKLNRTTGVFSTSENITVSVDRSSFSAGDYSGEIKLTVAENAISIPVRMNIPNKERPTVSLYSVDDVSFNSAMFRGAIISIGSAKVSRHGFCWNTAGEPTVENGQTCNFGDCSSAKDFTYNATGLEANTAYYVRVYAENPEGISYSNALKFQTSGTPKKPEVETGTVSGIESTQATVTGNIVHLGNVEAITQYGHVWSTTPNPTINNLKTELGKTNQLGTYHSSIDKLKPYTTYYVKAYAINSIGTSYGEEVSFTTHPGDIILQTSNATNISYNAATISCLITENGGHTISERGLCWSTSPSPTLNDNHKSVSTSSNNYEVKLIDLKEKTRYYARAYAKSQNGQTYYGNEIVFTTNAKDVNINKNKYGEDNNWER